MKTNLTKAIALAIVMTSFYNCSVEPTDSFQDQLIVNQSVTEDAAQNTTCVGLDPKARIANNGTIPFDFKIYSTDGTLLESEDNVLPGTISSWKSFSAGETLFVVTNTSLSGEKVVHQMDSCTQLNLIIDSNNQLTDAEPEDLPN